MKIRITKKSEKFSKTGFVFKAETEAGQPIHVGGETKELLLKRLESIYLPIDFAAMEFEDHFPPEEACAFA